MQPSTQSFNVSIRIKPRNNDKPPCIYLEKDQTLCVSSFGKKEYFTFDHVFDQKSTQQQLYDVIGAPVVQQAIKGYNCCVLAYGQTGSGKTYSILGSYSSLSEVEQIENKGILPRLLEDLFSKSRSFQQAKIQCTYLEIYNEQIIDLLDKQPKTCQIRQTKQGVYVEGLKSNNITNYFQALGLLEQGKKNRTVASTAMNSESSRSHSVFTINFSGEVKGEQFKIVKAKVHIVDLAGSQRIKQTGVEGLRLKQGCNINKSLSALGNVVNALIDNDKKRKYIPFRDSKLTFFLKDSIGSNCKTKLLASVSAQPQYLPDTISTLMFAKRAKIVKVKVGINQTSTQSFESLRNQLKRLRQQLANTRFINQNPGSRFQASQPSLLDQGKELVDGGIIRTFEENQKQFRGIIQLQQHQLSQLNNPSDKDSNIKKIYQQKRILQKKCKKYEKLLSNVPLFTSLFTSNLKFKQQLQNSKSSKQQLQNQVTRLAKQNCDLIVLLRQKNQSSSNIHFSSIITHRQDKPHQNKTYQRQQQMLIQYEQIIQFLQNHLKLCLDNFEQSHKLRLKKYNTNDGQNENEIDYLKLSVFELQNELEQVTQELNKKDVQIKTLKNDVDELNRKLQKTLGAEVIPIYQVQQKLQFILSKAQQQSAILQQQLQNQYTEYSKLKQKYIELLKQNVQLIQNQHVNKQVSSSLKKKLKQVIQSNSPSKKQHFLSDFESQLTLNQSRISDKGYSTQIQQILYQNKSLEQQLNKQSALFSNLESKLKTSSDKIISLTRELTITKQNTNKINEKYEFNESKLIELIKSQNQFKQKLLFLESEYRNYKKQMEADNNFKIIVKKETGKYMNQIYEEYRILNQRNMVLNFENDKLRSQIKTTNTQITTLNWKSKTTKIPTTPTLTKTIKTSSLQKPAQQTKSPSMTKKEENKDIKREGSAKRGFVFSNSLKPPLSRPVTKN